MIEWVLTVTSIAIIVLLCDVILPEGQTRKYIKTVLGVVVTFVIVQPLVGVFSADFNISQSVNAEMSVQQQYIDNAEQRQDEQKLINLKLTLKSSGFDCAEAVVSSVNKSVNIKLKEQYDALREQQINEISKKFFSSYKINIYWK